MIAITPTVFGPLPRVIFCWLLLFGIRHVPTVHAQAPEARPAPVKVATVQQQLLAPEGLASGEIQARHRVTLKAESSGAVSSVVVEGSRVRTGDTLAVIVDPAHSLRLQELQQAVASARARVDFLTQESQRLASLRERQLASSREVEQNKSDLAQARSALQAAQARWQQQQQIAQRLRVKAPFDGSVIARLAEPGAFVRAGEPVVELISDRLRAVVSVPIAAFPYVKAGQQWKIILTDGLDDEQNQPALARVSAVVPSANNASRHFQVVLAVPEALGQPLIDGMPVVAHYPVARPQKALLVPRDALVLRASGTYVFRVNDGQAEKVPVKTGSGQGDWIAVSPLPAQSTFLQAGDAVVVRGNERLRDGQAVAVLPTHAPGS
jgi:RND family efflux transporter MFP subunit